MCTYTSLGNFPDKPTPRKLALLLHKGCNITYLAALFKCPYNDAHSVVVLNVSWIHIQSFLCVRVWLHGGVAIGVVLVMV